MRNQLPYKRLLLDNNNNPPDKYATIDESNITSIVLDEMHLTRNAAVHMAVTMQPVTMEIKKLVGDRSGLIHAHSNQT